ncbi:unnamed protein product [Calypogeia fissa]
MCNTLLLAWSNRAFLRLKRYDSALADAERALELEPTNLKSLNRKAFEALQKYEKENSCFMAAFKLSSQDEDIREALKRTKICAQQYLQGEFDLSKFYLNRCKGVFQPCCGYVGPVEIGRVQGSGRGLFLTRAVVAGELLFVSIAVAIAPILPEPSIAPKGLRFQSKEQEADHLVTKLAKVAQICPRAPFAFHICRRAAVAAPCKHWTQLQPNYALLIQWSCNSGSLDKQELDTVMNS